MIGELDRHESNPFGFLGLEMNNRLFYKYPTRKNPGGTKETVRTATTEMMRLIQSRYYVPNNSAIVVTGDVRLLKLSEWSRNCLETGSGVRRIRLLSFPSSNIRRCREVKG